MKLKYIALLSISILLSITAFAQDSISGTKTYNFKDLNIIGTTKYSKTQIMRFTGFYVGKKIELPGQDIGNAIKKLWKQDLFSNVEFYVADITGDDIILTLNLVPLPELGEIKVKGVSKGKGN